MVTFNYCGAYVQYIFKVNNYKNKQTSGWRQASTIDVKTPSYTWLIILIRFITLKNNWMNPCVKTEGKCNESVNNEFKITRKRDSLHQIMRVNK